MGITDYVYRKRAGRPFFKFSEKSKGVVLAKNISFTICRICELHIVFQMVGITKILSNNKKS